MLGFEFSGGGYCQLYHLERAASNDNEERASIRQQVQVLKSLSNSKTSGWHISSPVLKFCLEMTKHWDVLGGGPSLVYTPHLQRK
jgi:hypothetical protein